jgi:hypothetical protein
MLCVVCDTVGLTVGKNGMPPGWRRVTISNPISMQKRGHTGMCCKSGCACKFLTDHWAAA